MALSTLSLCAGYGGLELGLSLAGVNNRAACYVEREAYAAANLAALMEAGRLDPAPIWSDLTTFAGSEWSGLLDCTLAGFPCQPWSQAGQRKGVEDERWIWKDIATILGDVRSQLLILENVSGLLMGGMGHVCGTLAELGYDTAYGCVRASDAGAPHARARVFLLGALPGTPNPFPMADSTSGSFPLEGRRPQSGEGFGFDRAQLANTDRWRLALKRGARCLRGENGQDPSRNESYGRGAAMADTRSARLQGSELEKAHGILERSAPHDPTAQFCGPFPPSPADREGWERWESEGRPLPSVCRESDGARARVDRLRLLGNGCCPQQVALALQLLAGRLWG